MPLMTIIMVLIVVGVLLWLVNLIPMQGTIKSISERGRSDRSSALAPEYFRAL